MNIEVITKLSPADYKIMLFLEDNEMVTREALLQHIWNETDAQDTNLLRQAIHHLRKRLEGTVYSIINIRAIRGYKLVVNHNQVRNT